VRSYNVAVAALAVGAPRKWTDNLLSQHTIPEVAHKRRGVARGISWAALVRIALVWELHHRLGCGVREAVALANDLLDPSVSSSGAGPVSVVLERQTLERDLHARLKEALEVAPRPRRGRPMARKGRAS
jgi:hypothetical protein